MNEVTKNKSEKLQNLSQQIIKKILKIYGLIYFCI